jgi:rhodanese-related sulfurtransferase
VVSGALRRHGTDVGLARPPDRGGRVAARRHRSGSRGKAARQAHPQAALPGLAQPRSLRAFDRGTLHRYGLLSIPWRSSSRVLDGRAAARGRGGGGMDRRSRWPRARGRFSGPAASLAIGWIFHDALGESSRLAGEPRVGALLVIGALLAGFVATSTGSAAGSTARCASPGSSPPICASCSTDRTARWSSTSARTAGAGPIRGASPAAWSCAPTIASSLDAKLVDLPRDREIILYCTDPAKPRRPVWHAAMDRGFRRVRPLEGGLDAWVASGFSIERGRI